MAANQTLTAGVPVSERGVLPHRPLCTYVTNSVLAGTTEAITPPTGYQRVVITSDAKLWLRAAATAVTPTTEVTDGTGHILIPADQPMAFRISEAQQFAFISPGGAANISLEWYKR